MKPSDTTVHLIGYGNPGRLDDGLGPALAGALEELDLPGVTIDADYQLNVEDAAAIADRDYAVFADAAVMGGDTFFFREIEPQVESISFSTHSVEPEAVLGMAHRMFGSSVRGFILGIRGYRFNEFGEELSAGAKANLRRVLGFIEPVLRERSFDRAIERQTVTS